MGAPFFKFRQFTVWHDRCAMKVGTDGVLLGAWAGQDRPGEILDIGTGSGLIALMLAQRFPKARITGIDCDRDAAMQAKENFTGSPWADRLRTVHIGLQGFCRDTVTAAERFDLIVSNPHDELLLLSAGLLTDSGVFSLIVPSESERSILRLADRSRLHLHRLTRVYSRPGSGVRRILASFGKSPVPAPVEDSLVLTDADGHRSAEHAALTKEFYLYEQ